MTLFDRFAAFVSRQVSHAWYFALCVLLILVWAPSFFIIGDVDTWQLIINTVTTIITFLMVALLQNSQEQDAHAFHMKLDAQSKVLAQLGAQFPNVPIDLKELRDSVGAEDEIGTR